MYLCSHIILCSYWYVFFGAMLFIVHFNIVSNRLIKWLKVLRANIKSCNKYVVWSLMTWNHWFDSRYLCLPIVKSVTINRNRPFNIDLLRYYIILFWPLRYNHRLNQYRIIFDTSSRIICMFGSNSVMIPSGRLQWRVPYAERKALWAGLCGPSRKS